MRDLGFLAEEVVVIGAGLDGAAHDFRDAA
jgi:hypothetical protein